jgi:hypothetical protein
MAVPLTTHAFTSAKSDGADTTVVRPSNWNAAHVGNGLGWFNVKDYGALGNNSANDTSAINSAIAALNSAAQGVLYFPSGTYLINAALTTITAEGLVLGDGWSDAAGVTAGATAIVTSSATATMFTTTTVGSLDFRDMALRGTAATPTAGACISVQAGGNNTSVSYHNLLIDHFYVGLDSQIGQFWTMDNCEVADCRLYNVKIQNTGNPDAGDWSIVNCEIGFAPSGVTASAIRWENSGGGKIIGNKINGGPNSISYGIDLAMPANQSTGQFSIVGNSLENFKTNAIRITTSTGTSSLQSLNITGNTISLATANSAEAIVANAGVANLIYRMVISSNTLIGASTAATYAISLTNCRNVNLIGNLYGAFPGGFQTGTGNTGVNNASNYAEV